MDDTAGGVITIADPIKPTTRAALDSLRADGVHVIMLTGDIANALRLRAVRL